MRILFIVFCVWNRSSCPSYPLPSTKTVIPRTNYLNSKPIMLVIRHTNPPHGCIFAPTSTLFSAAKNRASGQAINIPFFKTKAMALT
jgi:hypothetical protein